MPKYLRNPVVVEANQWIENGDHPLDGEGEGSVVRYFRHTDVPDEAPCRSCDVRMHEHGWIDEEHSIKHNGNTVCPGDYIITEIGESSGKKYFRPITREVFESSYTLTNNEDNRLIARINRYLEPETPSGSS